MKLRNLLRRLARDRRGASVTELALAAPLFALFAAGIIDFGEGLSERFSLQQSVNRTLELLQAGPVEGDAESNEVGYDFLVTEAASAAGVPESSVTMRQWLECDNAPQPEFGGDCEVGQETARYIQLSIDKLHEGRFFFGGRTMTASAAVRIQ